MNSYFLLWFTLIAGFFLGSIPFGILVARKFSVTDLRERGSGNIGATNVTRVVGFWPAGVITFVLDVSKGMILILILKFHLLEVLSIKTVTPTHLWLVGLMTVLGHCYNPFLRFQGGKGVATGFGVIMVLSPISGLLGMIGFGVTFITTKISSLSSLTGLLVCSLAYLVTNPIEPHLWVGGLIVLVIIIRHESNIDALLASRET